MWDDSAKGENVLFRIPRNIIWNDNVVVREDESAVFFRDGKVLTVLDRPGRFGLSTLNIPVLTELQRIVTGIQPVAEVYYVQRRELRGKFGSSEAMTFRDQDFGLVRLRIFGQFAYKKAIDTRSGIGALGLTDQKQKEAYLAFQAGGAMRDAAKQEGGAAGAGAGAGVGLGAGMGMGMIMASQLGQTMQPQQTRPNGIKCPSCSADLPSGSKFCTNCGNKIGPGNMCPKCNIELTPGAKFCPGCGAKIE